MSAEKVCRICSRRIRHEMQHRARRSLQVTRRPASGSYNKQPLTMLFDVFQHIRGMPILATVGGLIIAVFERGDLALPHHAAPTNGGVSRVKCRVRSQNKPGAATLALSALPADHPRPVTIFRCLMVDAQRAAATVRRKSASVIRWELLMHRFFCWGVCGQKADGGWR